MNEELKELYRYLRLSDYRNDYILEDEYEELEDIIKRNTYAKYLERI